MRGDCEGRGLRPDGAREGAGAAQPPLRHMRAGSGLLRRPSPCPRLNWTPWVHRCPPTGGTECPLCRRRRRRLPPPLPALPTPAAPLPAPRSAIVFNRFGGIKDQVYEEGTHIMLPWFERPIIYDVSRWGGGGCKTRSCSKACGEGAGCCWGTSCLLAEQHCRGGRAPRSCRLPRPPAVLPTPPPPAGARAAKRDHLHLGLARPADGEWPPRPAVPCPALSPRCVCSSTTAAQHVRRPPLLQLLPPLPLPTLDLLADARHPPHAHTASPTTHTPPHHPHQPGQVNIGLRVLTRPMPSKLPEIYRTLGTDYAERVLPSIIQVRARAGRWALGARARCCQRDRLRGRLHCLCVMALPGPVPRSCCPVLRCSLVGCCSRAGEPAHRAPTSFTRHAMQQETLKSVIAQYNASQLLTMREVRRRLAAALAAQRSGQGWRQAGRAPAGRHSRLGQQLCVLVVHAAGLLATPPWLARRPAPPPAGGEPRHPADTDAARALLQHRAG